MFIITYSFLDYNMFLLYNEKKNYRITINNFPLDWVYFKNVLQKFLSFLQNHDFPTSHGRISNFAFENSCPFVNVWVSVKIASRQFQRTTPMSNFLIA